MLGNVTYAIVIAGIIIVLGIFAMIAKWYKKAKQGEAIVRTGLGGTKVSFNGILVVPVLHKMEIMDISVKSVTIDRSGSDGLVCKDNLRADIKVAFFVRVDQTRESVTTVAQAVGCSRASDVEQLVRLFDAKFSEALKTVGKKFEFVDLYNKRDEFKEEIVNLVRKDLNGYILDDAAIDYLEQTPINQLQESNILDAEGIKKIIEITAREKVKANLIERDKEKTIKKQNVEAREVMLQLERQLAEKEEQQNREIENIKAREQAEIAKVNEEERLKSEMARIDTEEKVFIAEENKQREVLVAAKIKERTDAVETERVFKERDLERTEREKIVSIAQIEKEKALEEEKKRIQEVIRERVAIEKTVVVEEESIKDTQAKAEADRQKLVAVTKAEEEAEASLVQKIKDAEAEREAAEFKAKQVIINAEANQTASIKQAEAIKVLADAEAAKQASVGIAEAQVMEAKADALEKQGDAEAQVIKAKGHATSVANIELGEAEANVTKLKADADKEAYLTEAQGIEQKAEAMKKLDGVGQQHEEFKLRLSKEKEVELAQIAIQKDIADAQTEVLSTALKTAKIDIVGGEQVFFDKIVGAISNGKYVEKAIENSPTLGQFKEELLEGNGNLADNIKGMISRFGVTSDDLKNYTISSLVFKLMNETNSDNDKSVLSNLLSAAKSAGIQDNTPDSLGIK